MITLTTFHLQGGIDAEVKARNISPPNRKPSAAGSGYRTENLGVAFIIEGARTGDAGDLIRRTEKKKQHHYRPLRKALREQYPHMP